MFAPLYAAINNLLSRLTSGRAAAIDYLDAAITTRRSHSAADVWASGTRTLSAPPGAVKSVQSGLVNTSTVSTGSPPEDRYVDVTISSVDTNKAIVLHSIHSGHSDTSEAYALASAQNGITGYQVDGPRASIAHAYLVNATTLRIYCGLSLPYNAFSGRWQVVEFY